ncbi:hypothetical protein BDA99DRAFT_492613 [Phascolomyces articulosus]|uniref:Uncharacterized protein n=1 Tax=Phascolomyces articulosus TaxID=60185 RepID=A0AAD5KCC1_9FUNG|nr:hypothetical protein BDA99DRAFT_492613 [Phascolomyces articulosus]
MQDYYCSLLFFFLYSCNSSTSNYKQMIYVCMILLPHPIHFSILFFFVQDVLLFFVNNLFCPVFYYILSTRKK